MLNVSAQEVTVAEPEFADETLLLVSNSEGALLKRENGTIKTKAGASLFLTGIGKIKSRLTLAGAQSINTARGSSTTRLIIKAKDNATDPNSFINIFKFEIYNKKERRYQLAEVGTLSKAETNNLSSIDFKAKKYGESSYLIQIDDLTPGEYGIVIGDPNNDNKCYEYDDDGQINYTLLYKPNEKGYSVSVESEDYFREFFFIKTEGITSIRKTLKPVKMLPKARYFDLLGRYKFSK